jgi:hypothetical protein
VRRECLLVDNADVGELAGSQLSAAGDLKAIHRAGLPGGELFGHLLDAVIAPGLGPRVRGAPSEPRPAVKALNQTIVDVTWEAREDVATTICLCFVSDEGESAFVWHVDDDVAARGQSVPPSLPSKPRMRCS